MSDKVILREWAEGAKSLLDEETTRLIGQASFDLFYGPSGMDEDYPGFAAACGLIRRSLDDVVPSVVWVDEDGYWTESEPEDGEGFREVGRSRLLREVVGQELARHL